MDSEKTVVGKCPICGGDVVKTLKGWACVNSLTEQPSCQFFLFSMIGNRRILDTEAASLLADKKILLDGFTSKEGKTFSSILSFNQDGTVNMSYQIGLCPKCGGTLYVGSKAVSCSNFRQPGNPCNFTIWRNMRGHEFTLAQLEQIITNGATSDSISFYDNKGNRSEHRAGLNAEKEVVTL